MAHNYQNQNLLNDVSENQKNQSKIRRNERKHGNDENNNEINNKRDHIQLGSQDLCVPSMDYMNDLMGSDQLDQDLKQCSSEPVPDMYQSYKFGDCIPRSGKVFSYTFWRTRANADVFWSIQGNNEMEGAIGGIWIATQYFGNPQSASKFWQEITLTHHTEQNIQMTYASPLTEGENCVFISKAIVHHFRKDDNSIDFDFRVVRSKKNHRNRKKNF